MATIIVRDGGQLRTSKVSGGWQICCRQHNGGGFWARKARHHKCWKSKILLFCRRGEENDIFTVTERVMGNT